MIKHK